MREGISENEGNTEGSYGNNEDDTEAVALTDIRQDRNARESLRWIEEMIRAMQRTRGGGGSGAATWGEVGPGLEMEAQFVAPSLALRSSAFRASWLAREESSGCSSAEAEAEAEGSGKEKCDRDAHNKTAKVYCCSNDGHYAAVMSSDVGDSTPSADRDLGLSQSSSTPSNNEICYHNFMWNNNSDENPFNSSGGRDGGDDSLISKPEDLEVRMNDLLHMVFLSWTTLIYVGQQWFVGSGKLQVLMKNSGGVWILRIETYR